MPSDDRRDSQTGDRVSASLRALRAPITAYRSAVATAAERVRSVLAVQRDGGHSRLQLGAFAAGRIDAERFAALSAGEGVLDVLARSRLERSADVLTGLASSSDDAFVVDVAPGAGLGQAVHAALSRLGRAFAAATAADAVRGGRYDPARDENGPAGFSFERWNAGERRLAPPLVVTIDGADLQAGQLAEIMDGTVRIVIVVRGQCAPAPLARLITPGTFVVQTADTSLLDRVAAQDGPAVVALVSDDAAQFVHDPRAGNSIWQRLSISHLPEAAPRKSLGGQSAWQQGEDLRQLRALAERPALPAMPIGAFVPAGDGDPADRLAAWLVAQVSLDTVS